MSQRRSEVTLGTNLRLIVSHEGHQDLGNIEQKINKEPLPFDPFDQIVQHQPYVIEQ